VTESSKNRTSIAALLGILTLSAASMLWMFWRFPVITTLVTIGVFAVLGISARLARSVDMDVPELDHGNQSI
jgi:CHASE2 domain-containing sensor protein